MGRKHRQGRPEVRAREAAPAPPARSEAWVVAAIALLGLGVRLAYLHAYAATPLFTDLQLDEEYHDGLARRIAAGDWLLDPEAYHRAPLYYYLLGIVYRLVGSGGIAPRVPQSIGGALVVAGVYLLAREVLADRSSRVPRLAALFVALHPVLVYFDTSLLLESVVNVFHVAALVCLVRGVPAARPWLTLAAGLFLGLAAITRPNVLAFGPFALLWIWRASPRPLPAVALLLCGLALPIAPVTARNAIHGGDPVLISWQGGRELWIGNHPGADGMSAIFPGGRGTWWGGYHDSIAQAEAAEGRELRMSEVDRHYRGRVLSWMRSDPAAALGLLLYKAHLYLLGYEGANDRSIYYFRQHSLLLRALLWNGPIFGPWGILLPLAGAGAWELLRPGAATRRAAALLLMFAGVYASTTVLFFIAAKFRVPVIPVLAVFAAAGVGALRRARPTPALPIAVLLLLVANADVTGVHRQSFREEEFDRGRALQAQGDLAGAIQAYRDSIAGGDYPPAHNNLGTCLFLLRRYDEAELAFTTASRLAPRDPDPLFNLGEIAISRRQYERAAELMEAGAALAPGLARVHLYRGEVQALWPAGDRVRARTELERFLASPGQTEADVAYARQLLAGL